MRFAQHLGCFLVLALLLAVGCGPRPVPLSESQLLDDPAALDAKLRDDLLALRGAVDAYYQRYGSLPSRLPDLRDTPDQVPLIETIPEDPWSVPYLLRRIDQDITVYSSGADLIVGSADDIALRFSFVGVERKP